MSDIEKGCRPSIDEKGMVLRQCVGIVDEKEFDAKEEQTGCTNESVVLKHRSLVFEELTCHDHNTLKIESQKKDEENSAHRASGVKVVGEEGSWDAERQYKSGRKGSPAPFPLGSKEDSHDPHSCF